MASSDPTATAILPTDMNDSWDANVPFSSPIAVPEPSNILAELKFICTSAANTPLPGDVVSSPISEDTDSGLFRTGPTKAGMKRSFPTETTPVVKKMKTEYSFATEPVTPRARSKQSPVGISRITVSAPLSPPCQSLCTEETDEVLSMPPTPIPADLNNFPNPSKEQSARRRAIRRAALNKSRSRKEEGVTVVKSEPVTKTESETVQTGEPLDKKAARAIRNREAAMKSRVEAKQKMKKLQDENESLSVKVKTLSEENHALTSQLKNLLQHALGVSVAPGQDVKDVFNAFARVTSNSSTNNNNNDSRSA